MHRIFFVHLFGMLIASVSLSAQALDPESRITIVLKDKVSVTLMCAATSFDQPKSKAYYYLPCNLRLSRKADGTPEFLFLKFTSDEKTANGVNQGGLLHMLMVYGLDDKQLKELETNLKAKVSGAILKGPADLDNSGDNSVKIISAIINSKEMQRSLVFSAKAPTLPGSKIAVAAMLDRQGAQLFAATLEKARSISDLSIELSFKYTVRMPAIKGYLEYNWSKLDSIYQKDSATYTRRTEGLGGLVDWLFGTRSNHMSYDETQSYFRQLEEAGVLVLHIEESVADERVDKIRESIYEMLTNSLMDKESDSRQPSAKEKEAMPDIKHGDSYKFKKEIKEYVAQRKIERKTLNVALAFKKDISLTENFASWYNHVKDNPKCIGIVNLSQQDWLHRDINVVLDLDAEEMFGKEVNFATVSIRKLRSDKGANDFYQDVTFDRKTLEKEGNRVVVTYSKAQDDAPDLYEYKVQWSLRGGAQFPANDTTWTKGSWQGLNLAPPVKATMVRFEADQIEMKELGIKNVTLQIRHKKFGNEVETNFNLNANSVDGYVEKLIFQDRNMNGYASRLIFHDKELGAIATPWEAKLSTNYHFATVPKELRDRKTDWLKRGLEAAKVVLQTDDKGTVSKEQQVLDAFGKLLGVEPEKK